MVRLSVRRKTTHHRGFSVNRTVGTKARTATTKRKVAAKKTAIKAGKISPLALAKVKNLMSTLHDFIMLRKKKHGANDPVAKRLQKLHTNLGAELRKVNWINPGFVRYLNQLTPALKGVTDVPKTLRNTTQSLKKYIKQHVEHEVNHLINTIKKTIGPLQTELKRLEGQLNGQIKKARTTKLQPKADAALKQRFNALNNQIAKFKVFWFLQFNKFRLHGKKNIQTAANQVKKQLDELQNTVKKSLTIINRYSKAGKKGGMKYHAIFTPSQQKALETKWEHASKQIDMNKHQAGMFFEQLKAVKPL